MIKICKYLSILCLFELFIMILIDSGKIPFKKVDSGKIRYKQVGDIIKDFRDNHCEGEEIGAVNKSDEHLLVTSILY